MLCLLEYWSCGLSEVLWKSCFCPFSQSLYSGLKQSQANGFSDLCELMMSNRNPVRFAQGMLGWSGQLLQSPELGSESRECVLWSGLVPVSPCTEAGVQMLSPVPDWELSDSLWRFWFLFLTVAVFGLVAKWLWGFLICLGFVIRKWSGQIGLLHGHSVTDSN